MSNALLNALRRQLVAYEGAGMTEHAKRVKARLAVEEKAVAKADKKAEAEAEPADPKSKDEPAKKPTKETT